MTMNKIINEPFNPNPIQAMVPPGCQPAGPGAISAWVAGVPAPQGSKRPLGRQGGFGKHIMIESSKKVAPWREDVRQAFLDHHPIDETERTAMWSGIHGAPVIVKIVFVLPRTKAMRDRPSADFPMVQKPDLDKLGRAVLDALKSAGVYADDSQVVTLLSHKRRAEPGESTGALIHIEPVSVDASRNMTGAVMSTFDSHTRSDLA